MILSMILEKVCSRTMTWKEDGELTIRSCLLWQLKIIKVERQGLQYSKSRSIL